MQKINVNSLLRLSTNNQVRELQIILGNKNLNKLGEINNVDYSSASVSHKLMSSDDFSFVIYKNQNINGNEVNCSLWDDIDDLKLIYVKEYNEWFQIQVTPDDSEVITKKTITATSLCEAELSQIIIEGTEINTSDDPNVGAEANATTFYNAEDTSHSLLHRILEKAPHYTIAHVDETLMHIQRSFSIDGTSIYDFMTGTLTDEFGCLFLFDTNTRSIYVYDMETACLGDDCGYRSEDDFAVCPKCGGTIVHKAYGTDTNIFIDKTNLGENIQLTSDIDSVKNCFKVSGGDDNINAAIRQANPNGTNYFYYFNETTRKDMQSVPGLVEKLDAYDALVEEYNTTRKYQIESSFVNAYNGIVSYIKTYYPDKDISAITNSYTGWSKIPLLYNNINDTISYLQHGMLPTWHMSDITAQTQVELLTGVNMSFVAVDKDKVHLENLTLYTANSSVLSMAKSIINTSIYNVEIVSSSLSSQTWTGRFKVTNRSNEEDVAESTSNIVIEISNDVIAFINQKIKKSIARLEIDGIKDLFDIDDINLFKAELHKYCASQLTSYSSAYQTALSVLSEQGVSSEASDLHDSIYLPYYNRMLAVESELSHRNSQIDSIKELQAYLSNLITSTNLALNFESYLGTDLWKVFVSYRREDTYNNENYISDGLSNEEILTKANELIEVAKNELYKSGERQFTITAALQNLLLLVDENGNRIFAPILDNFTLGNFIKIKIDGKLYNVRLTEVIINYGDLSSIAVTFTNASHANMDKYDTSLEEIKAQTQTLATTYGGIVKQANQGEKANQTLLKMQTEGIDSAIYNMNSSNGSISIDKHGILLRNYDDVTQQYEDEQSRLGYNYFVYTTDNWKTGDLALGKQKFTLNNVEHNEYGLNSKFVISGKVIAGNIYSADYTTDSNGLLIKGTHWDLLNNNADLFDGKIRYRANTNTLTMDGVTIDWNNSTPPAISDIDGLNASLSNLGTQIDGKIDTWNQPLDPSASWNDEDKVKHKGDIWYNGNQTKIWGGSSWTTTTDTALKAIADSKKQVFTSTPIVPYYVGDLWITSTTSNAELKVCKTTRTSGSYATSDWVASLKYTDDTVANQANKVANSAYTLADTAKAIGDDLVNVLGYDGTKITGTYIYSPVISGVDLRGGHLFIGDDKKVGAYAEITSDGVLNCVGANISGKLKSATGNFAGSINVNDNFTVDGMGNCISHSLTSDNATLTGGKIGGWTINSSALYNDYMHSDGYLRRIMLQRMSNDIDWAISLQKSKTINDFNPSILTATWYIDTSGNQYNSGDMKVDGSMHVDGSMQVDGYQHNFGDMHVNGSMYVDGYQHNFGDMHVDGDMWVDGNQYNSGSIWVKGNQNNSGNMQVSGYLTCSSFLGGCINLTENSCIMSSRNQSLIFFASKEIKYGVFLGVRYSESETSNTGWIFAPYSSGELQLGCSGFRWASVWAKSGSITTSDKNEKNTINELDNERSLKFFNELKPSSFKFNDGTSDRLHYGFISQDVEEALIKAKIDTKDFAGFIKSEKIQVDKDNNMHTIEGEYTYSLRYEEFIALNTKIIQLQSKEIDILKERLNKLESLIQQ